MAVISSTAPAPTSRSRASACRTCVRAQQRPHQWQLRHRPERNHHLQSRPVPGCTPIYYVDSTQFKNAANVSATGSPIYLIGNAPRTAALNLRNPAPRDFDAAVHRSFPLPKDFGTFVFEVDCINVWNKTTMNGPGARPGRQLSNFGQISGAPVPARDFQFAGHFNF